MEIMLFLNGAAVIWCIYRGVQCYIQDRLGFALAWAAVCAINVYAVYLEAHGGSH